MKMENTAKTSTKQNVGLNFLYIAFGLTLLCNVENWSFGHFFGQNFKVCLAIFPHYTQKGEPKTITAQLFFQKMSQQFYHDTI